MSKSDTNGGRKRRLRMKQEQEFMLFLKANNVMRYKNSEFEVSFYPPVPEMHNDPNGNEKIDVERNLLPSERFERDWEQLSRRNDF